MRRSLRGVEPLARSDALLREGTSTQSKRYNLSTLEEVEKMFDDNEIAQSRNMEKLVECAYALEDYAALEGTLDVLQPDDPLLARMGTMFR